MIAALAAVIVWLGAAGPGVPGCWPPPVDAPIDRPFVAPLCTWCPGHRGVEYRTPANALVRAVATGRVTFSGVVAGTRYLVVQLPDGRKVTYGLLRASPRRVGDRVSAGAVVGRTGGRLYLGVRVGGRPVDPVPLLCPRRGPVRLVPVR